MRTSLIFLTILFTWTTAFDQTSACTYHEGSESIVRQNEIWKVSFSLEFLCSQSSKLKSFSISFFDLPGFSSGFVTIVNGDLETSIEIDGYKRKVGLW